MREAIPPLPQNAFMAWYSVKKVQEQLYFTFCVCVCVYTLLDYIVY